MVAHKSNGECQKARMHYYEFLTGQDLGNDPGPGMHIRHCPDCQAEVNRLRECLDREQAACGALSEDAIRHLRLHFGWVGRPVTCDIVRPFLPALANPRFAVTIPTPITVHIDHCRSCAGELETLRTMELDPVQFCRLGQLLAESSRPSSMECTISCGQIEAIAQFRYESCTTEDLRHVCLCPECHRLLLGYRQESLRALNQTRTPSDSFLCEHVTAKDLFDYVLPYGIRPEDDSNSQFRPSLVSHLLACPKCMARMIRLGDTFDGLLQPHSSGIVTEFSFGTNRRATTDAVADLYSGWPVRVSILETAPTLGETSFPPASTSRESAIPGPQPKSNSAALRPWIKPLAAAAAILIIAYLMMSNPIAGAVELKQVYEALGAIPNVYMRVFGSEKGSSDPIQEILVCRSMGLKMIRNSDQSVLWDIPNASLFTRDNQTATRTTAELNPERIDRLKQEIQFPGEILPFRTLKDAPRTIDWKQVEEPGIEADTTVRIYECTWADRSASGKEILRKWRGHLDSTTLLPSRIERWEKESGEADFEQTNVILVEYPTDQQALILAEIEKR